jgi:hypothetical protein
LIFFTGGEYRGNCLVLITRNGFARRYPEAHPLECLT